MLLPYKTLWQTMRYEFQEPALFVHKHPQIWASYLGLYSLAVEGGMHLFLAKGYEKEAFYRACCKWLSCVGLESFLTKNGLEIAQWGSLKIMYPLASLELLQTVKTCSISNPYMIKRQFYHTLLEILPSNGSLWVFHPERLPAKKGDSALPNQVYKKFFWHNQLKRVHLPKQAYDSYEEWAFVKVWLDLLCRLAQRRTLGM